MNVMKRNSHLENNSHLEGNVVYSVLLSLSTYLIPLVVFPYISRIIGPSGVGAVDAVDYTINYFIQFSMMGLSTIGVREVAMAKGDKERLNTAFSSLFVLNLMLTVIAMVILTVLMFSVPSFSEKRSLYLIGMFKLLSNVFLVEWLFRGFEDFRYITLRSISVRLIFLVLVFCLVKDKDDIIVYYILFVSMTVANAVLNWSRHFGMVSFGFSYINIRKYASPFFLLGLFSLVTSVYLYLNAVFLDFATNDVQVGYYTTSTRLYNVLMAMFTSVTTVLVPRLSSLKEHGDTLKAESLVEKMFSILFMFALPVIIFFLFSSDQIIELFAGDEFIPASATMKIVMLQVMIIGIEQIVIIQIMVPNKLDYEPVVSAVFGASVSILGNCFLLSRFGAIGAAISWIMAELTTMGVAIFLVKRRIGFQFPWKPLVKAIYQSVPYLMICIVSMLFFDNSIIRMVFQIMLFVAYFIILDAKIAKTMLVSHLLKAFIK